MDQEINITAKMTLNDYKRFQRNLMSYTIRGKSSFSSISFIYMSTIYLGVIFYSLYSIYHNVEVGNPLSIRSLLVPLIIILLPIIIFVLLPNYSAKKYYESKKSLQSPIQFTFNTDGVKCKTIAEEGFTSWNSIYKAIEYKGTFLLYISTVEAYFIHKSYFDNVDDYNKLKELVLKNITFEAKKRSKL